MNKTEGVIIERLDTLIKQNGIDHGIICRKQDHTNGDVTALKAYKIAQEARDDEKSKWMDNLNDTNDKIHKNNYRNLKIIVGVGMALLASVIGNMWISIGQNTETRVRLDQMDKNIEKQSDFSAKERETLRQYVDLKTTEINDILELRN